MLRINFVDRKKYWFFFLMIVFSLFFPISSLASKVTGSVSEKGKGYIAGAKVSIKCGDVIKSTATTSKGSYVLSGLKRRARCVISLNRSNNSVPFITSKDNNRVNVELRGHSLRRK